MLCNKCGAPVNHEALYCHNCGEAVRIEKPVQINRLPIMLTGLGCGIIGMVLIVLWIWQSESYFYSAAVGFLLGILVSGAICFVQKGIDRISILIGAAIILATGMIGNFLGWGAAIWGPGTETDYDFLTAGVMMLYSFLLGYIDPVAFWFSALEVCTGALIGAAIVCLLCKRFSKKPLPKL